MNLIDNAVKFGPRGGLIRMRLIEENGSVLFTIDNEGKSIPDEDGDNLAHKRKAEAVALGFVRTVPLIEFVKNAGLILVGDASASTSR